MRDRRVGKPTSIAYICPLERGGRLEVGGREEPGFKTSIVSDPQSNTMAVRPTGLEAELKV